MTTAETITGVVEARNDTGIRINGAWANRSRFKPVDLPDIGTLVRLGVDAKGYITTLEILESEDASPRAGATSSRDRQIARLSVLKSAAAFAAGREEIKSADVLRIADSWLAWVEEAR